MKMLLPIAAFILLANGAHAACGFGATFGAGSTDSVATGYSTNVSGPRTYSVWAYRNGDGGGSLGRLFDTGNGIVNMFSQLSLTSYTITQLFSVTQGQWTTGTIPSLNVWHHILFTYDNSSTSNVPVVYFDGVSQTVTQAGPAPSGTATTTSASYYIGNRASGGRNWDGKLRDFAIWNAILTANEAKALANGASPLQIRPTQLAAYIPCQRTTAAEADWGPSHGTQTVTGTAFTPDPPIQPYPLVKYAQ